MKSDESHGRSGSLIGAAGPDDVTPDRTLFR